MHIAIVKVPVVAAATCAAGAAQEARSTKNVNKPQIDVIIIEIWVMIEWNNSNL